ncbi:hypothetical protein Tco_0243059 [Tanacetum coccineum]
MYGFKECSSCGTLYNRGHCCSNVSSVGKFIHDSNKAPDSLTHHKFPTRFPSNQQSLLSLKRSSKEMVNFDNDVSFCMRFGSGLSKETFSDTDILLTIKDDILHEKVLKVNLIMAKIEALKDNPTPSSSFVTKSSSTSLNFYLEETNTFDNSLPEFETFCFNLEEISSGSPTSYLDLSLPDYEAFFCNSEPDSGNFTIDVVEDIFDNPTREPRVHVPNVFFTHPSHPSSGFRILQPKESFRYLGSVIHRSGRIGEDVDHRIGVAMLVEGSRRRGRPKLIWEDRLKKDMKELLLSEEMTSDRNAWRDRIRISG